MKTIKNIISDGISVDFYLRKLLEENLNGIDQDFVSTLKYHLDPLYLEGFEFIHRIVSEIKTPKCILTNNHGIYHKPIHSYILATLKSRDCPIIINQPGMLHTQISYFYQVTFESNLASKYLGWGNCSGNIDSDKFIPFGSYYRAGVPIAEPANGSVLVILPQIPRMIRALSCFWNGIDREEKLLRWQKSIEHLKNVPNIKFRCKSCDEKTYSKWIKDLITADINEGDRFASYETIIVMYPSTAIIEGLSRCKKIILHFELNDIILTEESFTEYQRLIENEVLIDDPEKVVDKLNSKETADCNEEWVSSFLDKYGRKINPCESTERLLQLIRSL